MRLYESESQSALAFCLFLAELSIHFRQVTAEPSFTNKDFNLYNGVSFNITWNDVPSTLQFGLYFLATSPSYPVVWLSYVDLSAGFYEWIPGGFRGDTNGTLNLYDVAAEIVATATENFQIKAHAPDPVSSVSIGPPTPTTSFTTSPITKSPTAILSSVKSPYTVTITAPAVAVPTPSQKSPILSGGPIAAICIAPVLGCFFIIALVIRIKKRRHEKSLQKQQQRDTYPDALDNTTDIKHDHGVPELASPLEPARAELGAMESLSRAKLDPQEHGEGLPRTGTWELEATSTLGSSELPSHPDQDSSCSRQTGQAGPGTFPCAMPVLWEDNLYGLQEHGYGAEVSSGHRHSVPTNHGMGSS